jgi:7-keto-8-aminopelargonate synthetase-like enzyme
MDNKLMNKNNYSNLQKVVSLSSDDWELGLRYGVLDIVADEGQNGSFVDENGHDFYHMVSCSYLNLDRHPKVIMGIKTALDRYPQTNITCSRTRLISKILYDTEEELNEYFKAQVIVGSSCSAMSEGVLPLLASGVLTNNIKPKIIFDKLCHFSMNIIKPICADETNIVTCDHNDISFIENECKHNPVVVYVCDGAYSTGGVAKVKELLDLQNRYNLYVYYDDSHSLSVCGQDGYGYVREIHSEINDKTIIVFSMAKAFGAGAGGIAMLSKNSQMYKYIKRYAGPLLWSRPVSTATIGAIQGSLVVHKSNEFKVIQKRLKDNIAYFDSQIYTSQSGSEVPIRFVTLGESLLALEAAKTIYQKGFYVSPLFFPIVARGKAGLRMMINNRIPQEKFLEFCNVVKGVINAIS